MKTTMKTLAAGIVAFALLFTGCKKDAGPQGPAGPQGATGAQGPAGPDAKNYDISVSIPTSTTWASYNLVSNTVFDGDDVVLVYWKEFSTNWLVQIPYHYKTSSSTVGVDFWSEITSSTLFINTTRDDGNAGSPWASTANLDFRVVIVKSSSIKKPNLPPDLSYESVKNFYGLKD